MRKLARSLVLVLIGAFAVATLAPVADATAMAIQMSLAHDSGGCGGCPGDDGKLPLCDQTCVASLLALPPAPTALAPVAAADVVSSPADFWAGRTGPPDPSPPKTFLLS